MWSSVWDTVVWAWTYALPALFVGSLLVGVVSRLREPVQRPPWAYASRRAVAFFFFGLVVFTGGDAFFGAERPVYERLWKGSVAVLFTGGFVVDTVRWLRAGQPNEPVPVEDDEDDDDDDDDDDDEDGQGDDGPGVNRAA